MPDNPLKPILIIDDDKKLCRLLADYLEPMGYTVSAVHTGPEGVTHALAKPWHAVILDMMLPGMDGLQVLQKIRLQSQVPILMLTARGDEADRIVGLEFGADDYLPKTFSSRELLARLRAVTRRLYTSPKIEPTSTSAPPPLEQIVVGDISVCPDTRSAKHQGRDLFLTPVEFDLLHSLAKAAGRIKTRDQLLEEIRDRDYEVFDRSIDVHISALRKKLHDDAKSPRYIRTCRSAGYMLQAVT